METTRMLAVRLEDASGNRLVTDSELAQAKRYAVMAGHKSFAAWVRQSVRDAAEKYDKLTKVMKL